jgi:hypothetical protein
VEAKAALSSVGASFREQQSLTPLQKLVFSNLAMIKPIAEALDKLRGAVMIVYPMGLPPYDEARLIMEGKDDVSGKQAALSVVPEDLAQL